ncbi:MULTISPECIES: hypothetical protein [Providencia]|nr:MULTISPECIES: hypothetical protein [Providencia]MCW4539336.1 hypothetical protein [Providencia rettgeri]MDX4117384.1 hypothetical protein [Providencia rettgeri]
MKSKHQQTYTRCAYKHRIEALSYAAIWLINQKLDREPSEMAVA